MPKHTFHFLNVKNGDCSIIEHGSGHISVIDVCNARKVKQEMSVTESLEMFSRAGSGNFQQKKHPVNPIEYLKKFGINSIFRFMLTHPDMDHMDGIKDLFEEFSLQISTILIITLKKNLTRVHHIEKRIGIFIKN